MVFEEKSVSSFWPQNVGSMYSEQPLDHLSVAVPSRSVHPDSDRARIPSASVLNAFGVMGSADSRAGACTPRTCPADGTASTMRAPPWSGRSPSVAARVSGYPRGGIRTAKSTGNHCVEAGDCIGDRVGATTASTLAGTSTEMRSSINFMCVSAHQGDGASEWHGGARRMQRNQSSAGCHCRFYSTTLQIG